MKVPKLELKRGLHSDCSISNLIQMLSPPWKSELGRFPPS